MGMLRKSNTKCTLMRDDRGLTTRNTMMDKRGEGMQLILDSRERLSGKRPVYTLIDASELRPRHPVSNKYGGLCLIVGDGINCHATRLVNGCS